MSEMTFSEAIDAILDNKRVTRKEWNDVRSYGLLKDSILQLHKAGEAEEITHPWILNDGDLMADDWIVIT